MKKFLKTLIPIEILKGLKLTGTHFMKVFATANRRKVKLHVTQEYPEVPVKLAPAVPGPAHHAQGRAGRDQVRVLPGLREDLPHPGDHHRVRQEGRPEDQDPHPLRLRDGALHLLRVLRGELRLRLHHPEPPVRTGGLQPRGLLHRHARAGPEHVRADARRASSPIRTRIDTHGNTSWPPSATTCSWSSASWPWAGRWPSSPPRTRCTASWASSSPCSRCRAATSA